MSKKNKEKVAVAEDDSKKIKEISKKQKEDKNPLEELKVEVEKEKDRYLRLFAEFENYKKRTGKERLELFKTAGQEVITSLLPVLDDFERALKEIEKSDDDTLYKGVELISSKLNETLRQKGLEVIKTETGDSFDADIHEAITQIPAPADEMKGKIIDVIEKGYSLGEKIIRYPKVVIGN
jgi:molecular chaperone GrpE